MTKTTKWPSRLLQALVWALGVFIFGVAAIAFLHVHPGPRRVFYYPAFTDGATYAEVRFLGRNPVQGDLALFVDELLLGPLTKGYRPLFPAGTRQTLCVAADRAVYLDLAVPVNQNDTSLPLKEAEALLRKNIRANFPKLTEVTLFVNGSTPTLVKIDENA